MRKPYRVALTIVGVLVAIPILLMAATATVNAVAVKSEASKIAAYGRLIPVAGKKMNVVIKGEGSDTIVLLPGLGTAAPGLDFQPLIKELSASHRVIAVEPFGTGLSDQTDTERTAANITGELHEALQYLGVDRYVLMGHSVAGIYALNYSASHASELIAWVGIDSSVPDQPGWNDPLPTQAIAAVNNLGITRVLTAIAPDPYEGLPYDDQAKEQLKLLSTKNAAAATLINEMENTPANFASVSAMTFPKDLPVLLFVASNNTDVQGWDTLHEQQASSVIHGKVIPLKGDHYLHHTLSPEIAQDTSDFLSTHPPR